MRISLSCRYLLFDLEPCDNHGELHTFVMTNRNFGSLTPILLALIALTPVVCSAQKERRLEGCVDPAKIAKVLSGMRRAPLRPISEDQFRARWPVELADIQSEPKTRRTLLSNDRTIRGRFQCVTEFEVDVSQDGPAAVWKLDGVIINYSAYRRNTLVAMAKLFGRAVGMGAADLKTVGADKSQGYQWETNKGERLLYFIDLHFTREAGLWKMYFLIHVYVVEP